jgi:hypothetical protein
MAHGSDVACAQILITVSCACPSWVIFTKVMSGSTFDAPSTGLAIA